MKIKVFYNKDCGKYGILKYKKDYMGYRWKQVLIQTDKNKLKTYTKYKGVAVGWMQKLKNKTYKEFSY